MRVDIPDPHRNTIVLIREPGEARVRDESELLHRLKKVLIADGEDVIKKRMWKDGHLVSDEQQYVRSRDLKNRHAYAIFDPMYSQRNSAADYNKEGSVIFWIRSMGEGEPIVGPGYTGPIEWYPS